MIFLGLGSSIGNAENIFKSTEKDLEEKGIKVIKKSKILKNPPFGNVAKNEFSNAVWEVETNLSPQELLNILKKIEEKNGRTKTEKWADRTLDLDILIFHDLVLETEELIIPHSGIPQRIFVLKPLAELVDKSFKIPKFGLLQSLLAKLNEN